jgi:hypothetical protein
VIRSLLEYRTGPRGADDAHGLIHSESSHHASEYWAWFRKTPELTAQYLNRRWDYLDCPYAIT